jgi:hypothetical protein
MVAVAIVAVGMGGTLEYRRLRELSRQYSLRALRAGGQASWFRRGANMSHEEWLAGREKTDRMNRESRFKAAYFPDQERCKRLVPYHESLSLKYDRAARYPFLPVEPNPPYPR